MIFVFSVQTGLHNYRLILDRQKSGAQAFSKFNATPKRFKAVLTDIRLGDGPNGGILAAMSAWPHRQFPSFT
jgi:hypothetical protein